MNTKIKAKDHSLHGMASLQLCTWCRSLEQGWSKTALLSDRRTFERDRNIFVSRVIVQHAKRGV